MTDAGKVPASDISYLDLVIIFSVIVYVINTYLDFRQVRRIACGLASWVICPFRLLSSVQRGNTILSMQLKAISKPSPPAPLRDTYSPVEYRKTQDYQLDKW